MNELEDVLQHFGVKGMKWGVRRQKDIINSKDRTIKKGTTIQNITSREFKNNNRHLYAAYTSYDKTAYADLMGNFMYNEKGYKNEFVVKKDINIPSDKKLIENFIALAKSNPKQVSKDMSNAYNDLHVFSTKSAKNFERKISKINSSESLRGEKLAKQYISLMVSNKAAKSRAEFFGGLIKQGFNGMSDINDRDSIGGGTQDPLIIFNPSKVLGDVKSVKLTKEDLDRYDKIASFNKEFSKQRTNLKEVQHSILKHHGVKGMKWGVHKSQFRQRIDVNASKATEGKIKRLGSDINMARYFTRGHIRRKLVKYDKKWYDNLDTGKQYIEKGTTLRRVVRGVDNDVLTGRLYVSKLKSDSKMYRATIPYFQESGASGKKSYHSVYEVELKTKQRLAMPSAKERVDAFIETLQKPEGKQWLKDNGYKDQIDELNAKEVGLKYYQKFNKYAGDQNLKMNDAYFNSLKQKGYKALLDDNDAGVWSKQPTILLSPKGTVKVTSVHQLTADDINKAQREVLKYRQYGKG